MPHPDVSAQSSRFNTALATPSTGDFAPASEAFVQTEFHVAVIAASDAPEVSDFRFAIHTMPNVPPFVAAFQWLERLPTMATNKAIRMRGSDLVAMLHPDLAIVVYLSADALVMPAGHVGELRADLARTG